MFNSKVISAVLLNNFGEFTVQIRLFCFLVGNELETDR